MKAFFERYSYESVRLALNQIAISMFGFALAMTAGKAESDALTDGDITGSGKSAKFTVTLTNPDKNVNVTYIYPAAMAKENGTVNYDALYKEQDGTLATDAVHEQAGGDGEDQEPEEHQRGEQIGHTVCQPEVALDVIAGNADKVYKPHGKEAQHYGYDFPVHNVFLFVQLAQGIGIGAVHDAGAGAVL